MTGSYILDLRLCPQDVPLHSYAFSKLRDLKPGEQVLLISPEEPDLLLRQLQHQLRNRLAWQLQNAEPGRWEVRVQRREDVAPTSLQDLLGRDHERLDLLFVDAMRQLDQGHDAGAREALLEFIEGLRRHIRVENELLIPTFPRIVSAGGDDMTALIQREHDRILEQAVAIEALLTHDELSRAELDLWIGLLAGTLSKHEHREETLIFPRWDIARKGMRDGNALVQEAEAWLQTPHVLH